MNKIIRWTFHVKLFFLGHTIMNYNDKWNGIRFITTWIDKIVKTTHWHHSIVSGNCLTCMSPIFLHFSIKISTNMHVTVKSINFFTIFRIKYVSYTITAWMMEQKIIGEFRKNSEDGIWSTIPNSWALHYLWSDRGQDKPEIWEPNHIS